MYKIGDKVEIDNTKFINNDLLGKTGVVKSTKLKGLNEILILTDDSKDLLILKDFNLKLIKDKPKVVYQLFEHYSNVFNRDDLFIDYDDNVYSYNKIENRIIINNGPDLTHALNSMQITLRDIRPYNKVKYKEVTFELTSEEIEVVNKLIKGRD